MNALVNVSKTSIYSEDLYVVLGVPRNATRAMIAMAKRNLSKRYHPDLPTGSEELMAKVNFAFDILSSPHRRTLYDNTGATELDEDVLDSLRQHYIQVMMSALTSGKNPVKLAKKEMETRTSQVQREINSAKNKLKRIESAVLRFKHTEGLETTLMGKAIAELKANMENAIDQAHMLLACTISLKPYLTAFSFEEPEEEPSTFSMSLSNFAFRTNDDEDDEEDDEDDF